METTTITSAYCQPGKMESWYKLSKSIKFADDMAIIANTDVVLMELIKRIVTL